MNETQGHGRAAKQKTILECLRQGGTRKAAYRKAGIHVDTFYEWLKQPSFSELVLRAEAEAEQDDTALIRDAAATDWRAAAWLHEHHPQRRDDWKKVTEIDWRTIPAEVLFALLGAGGGDQGAESAGDRLATATSADDAS